MAFSYNGDIEEAIKAEKLYIPDGEGHDLKAPIVFQTKRPDDPNNPGHERVQIEDAVRHMRYAKTLELPTLTQRPIPRLGRAIIVGGAPSVKDHFDEIKELAKDPYNRVFAINWSHSWLLDNGFVPDATVFFEIDPEPDSVLLKPHKDITYYICCHCHEKTFDSLKGYKRVLWHTYPNSDLEKEVSVEIFPDVTYVGGGIGTFTRTISVALMLGFRHLDLFGCDSSFPDDKGTHVEGYETPMSAKDDGLFVYAKDEVSGDVKRFKTLGYLALQHEEFKEYCRMNHFFFSCRVHGNGLLPWSHRRMYPLNYVVDELKRDDQV